MTELEIEYPDVGKDIQGFSFGPTAEARKLTRQNPTDFSLVGRTVLPRSKNAHSGSPVVD